MVAGREVGLHRDGLFAARKTLQNATAACADRDPPNLASLQLAFLPAEVRGRTGRRETDDRQPTILGAIKGANPEITFLAICARLGSMRERTPHGRTNWQPSSVRTLLEPAERLGLL